MTIKYEITYVLLQNQAHIQYIHVNWLENIIPFYFVVVCQHI